MAVVVVADAPFCQVDRFVLVQLVDTIWVDDQYSDFVVV